MNLSYNGHIGNGARVYLALIFVFYFTVSIVDFDENAVIF